MTDFVHLHLHTEYSLLDGAARTDQLFARAAQLGQRAVAITDHGNMAGVLQFFKQAVRLSDPEADPYVFCRERRPFVVKPIIGCELYIVDDMNVKVSNQGRMPKFNHIVLLAKNQTGYHNLVRLVSLGYTQGMYYKPRIDFALLQQYSQGLVCLSACLAGQLPQALLNGSFEQALDIARNYQRVFGDDYYIEIQDHGILDQRIVLPRLVEVARELGIKLVATNDVHYIDRSDAEMQKVLQCVYFRTTLEERGEGSDDYFPTQEFYLKSGDEMAQLFGEFPDALASTTEIADKCDCYYFHKDKLLPPYIPQDGSTPLEFLRRMVMDGLTAKYRQPTAEHIERAERELDIIQASGYVEYFLIVWDFIHYAEQNNIPVGPGRGSGVGSIVAYAIGITKVDPMRYDLVFERFLNPERVSSPDFDIDFCVDGREQVINYVIERYQPANVAQIATFGTLATKAAVKDVGRVYNIPFADVNAITKVIPGAKATLPKLLGLEKSDMNCPALIDIYQSNPTAKRVIDMAMQIEGMPRQTGIHAAGVVICRDPVSEHIPLMLSVDEKVTTQFNMVECEELGLLKMDFLGLNTLTDIDRTLELIFRRHGRRIDFYDMEYDDPAVFRMIGEGDTHGVFQLEGGGMKAFMHQLRPTVMEDIIAGISLYRPGPMAKIPEYVSNKHNPGNIRYAHPLLEPILATTYGIIIYQEQVMQIVRSLGGYTLGRADNVRRLMSKKKGSEMLKERDVFVFGTEDGLVPGAVARGVPEEVAMALFDDMQSFSSYAFNKSHAAAYAYLAYQTAWLKHYYPLEFFATLLNNRIDSIDETTNYLTHLKERGVQVLPPCVNRSDLYFIVEGDAIRMGLSAIKNVGTSVVEFLVSERNAQGEFADFGDFLRRIVPSGINRKKIESMILTGCFDCFGVFRSQLMAVYEKLFDMAVRDRKAADVGQFSMFDMMPAQSAQTISYPNLPEYPLHTKLKHEKDCAGVYLTGHPLDAYREVLGALEYNTAMLRALDPDSDNDPDSGDDNDRNAPTLTDGMRIKLGGILVSAASKYTRQNLEMGIGRLEDMHGVVEVMVSPSRFGRLKMLFAPDKLVLVSGTLSLREGSPSIWVDTINELAPIVRSRLIVAFGFETSSEELLDRVVAIASAYPGNDRVYVRNTDNNQLYDLEISVTKCDTLVLELRGVGVECE